MIHELDTGDPERTELKLANWTALGMTPAAPVNVIDHPNTTAHKLLSDAVSGSSCGGPHDCVARDVATYGNAWAKMLGTP